MTDRPDPRSEATLLAHVPEGPVPSSRRGERLLDLVRVMARQYSEAVGPWRAYLPLLAVQ